MASVTIETNWLGVHHRSSDAATVPVDRDGLGAQLVHNQANHTIAMASVDMVLAIDFRLAIVDADAAYCCSHLVAAHAVAVPATWHARDRHVVRI